MCCAYPCLVLCDSRHDAIARELVRRDSASSSDEDQPRDFHLRMSSASDSDSDMNLDDVPNTFDTNITNSAYAHSAPTVARAATPASVTSKSSKSSIQVLHLCSPRVVAR